MEGFNQLHVSGGVEPICEEAYVQQGVPVGDRHRERPKGVAKEAVPKRPIVSLSDPMEEI